jgi:hypothetical protein
MRVLAVLFIGLAVAATASAVDVKLLGSSTTTNFHTDVSAKAEGTVDDTGTPHPQPYAAFGISVTTPGRRQRVGVQWSLHCYQNDSDTDVLGSGSFRRRTPIIVWKPPTLQPADACYLLVSADRAVAAKGRLRVRLYGRPF